MAKSSAVSTFVSGDSLHILLMEVPWSQTAAAVEGGWRMGAIGQKF